MNIHLVDSELDGCTTALLDTVDRLQRSHWWAEDERPIEVVHTHISTVLVGRRHVLKLKKPVDFGFLDYTTLEKRRNACRAEVRLNRRLCPDVYLAVEPIVRRGREVTVSDLAHGGKILDYAVLMRRLPTEKMLDRLVASGAADEQLLARVAWTLAGFHTAAARGPEIDRFGGLDVIRGNWVENFEQTAPFVGRTIDAPVYDAIRAWVGRELEALAPTFHERVRSGRICDGHGDVRCESVCVDDRVYIYDCVEFNERFRCGDVASEVAFLAMDLAARGRPDLGYSFFERYEAESGDSGILRLLPFYQCYRAFVRGKVLGFQLDESEIDEETRSKAAVEARRYFEFARRCTRHPERPVLLAVTGLSGTGKTTLARAVGIELGLRVVSSDAVRRSLYTAEQRRLGYGVGAYGPEANRRTYAEMLDRAGSFLHVGEGVILDATFRRAADRETARLLAETCGAAWGQIECVLPEDEARRRLDVRVERGEILSDATIETYERQRDEYEAADSDAGPSRLVLDTTEGIAETGQRVCDWLVGRVDGSRR